MTKKNSTQVNSVSFPKTEKYLFYGFTFELPSDCQFSHIEIVANRYIAHTSQGEITLRHCLKCKRLLELTNFYDYNASCKVCHRIMTKRWSKNNPEKARSYNAKYNKKYRFLKKCLAAGVK